MIFFSGRHSGSETRHVREEAGDREQAAQRPPGAGQRAHALRHLGQRQ